VSLRNERLYIDEALSEVAVDYQQSLESALQDKIFPVKSTRYETGTYPVFDANRRFRTYNDLRADKTEARSIEIKYSKATFSQEEYALRGGVSDRERDQAMDPISPEQDIVELVTEALALRREERARDLVFPATYSPEATVATLWDSGSALVQCIKDCHAAKKDFHKKNGKLPNLAIIVPRLWDIFMDSSAVNSPGWVLQDRLKYSQSVLGVDITPKMVANLLDIPEIVIPKILVANPVLNGTVGTAGIEGASYIWDETADGDPVLDIVFLYVNPKAGAKQLTLGWTFTSQNLTVFRYREPHKRVDWFEAGRVEVAKIIATSCLYRLRVLGS
jgi:hypothetical protein